MPPAQFDSDRLNGDRRITMWGAPSTGKTTFLAALSVALLRQNGMAQQENGERAAWRVVGVDKADSDALTTLMKTLAGDRAFPPATTAVEQYRWELVGTVQRTIRVGRFRRERRKETVTIPLDLADAPGGAAAPTLAGHPRWEALLKNMERSKGIVFFFDPVREFTDGDAFSHTFAVVNELSQRMRDRQLPGGRLPHYVAVCIAKFDEIRVFKTAERLGMIEFDTDPPRFPRVPDDEAREFFASLCEVSRSGDAEMVLSMLEQTFQPERIRYFATSAIGFYVDRRSGGVFDPDNFQNHVPGRDKTEPSRIRGSINPVNVVEPMVWLGRNLLKEPAE